MKKLMLHIHLSSTDDPEPEGLLPGATMRTIAFVRSPLRANTVGGLEQAFKNAEYLMRRQLIEHGLTNDAA